MRDAGGVRYVEGSTVQLQEHLALLYCIWGAKNDGACDFYWKQRPATAQAETPCVSRALPARG